MRRMTWRPDLTVAAIVQRDDRFLIVEERISERLVFNQPAGHVEDGESIIAATVRETLEETAAFRATSPAGCVPVAQSGQWPQLPARGAQR
jgi:NADH pyrophosphatase NudC (nudix superfamily)